MKWEKTRKAGKFKKIFWVQTFSTQSLLTQLRKATKTLIACQIWRVDKLDKSVVCVRDLQEENQRLVVLVEEAEDEKEVNVKK